jgi:hypothetical protein
MSITLLDVKTEFSLSSAVIRIGLLQTVKLSIRKLVTQHFKPINYIDKNSGILALIPQHSITANLLSWRLWYYL